MEYPPNQAMKNNLEHQMNDFKPEKRMTQIIINEI
jgi:hypothetical protein